MKEVVKVEVAGAEEGEVPEEKIVKKKEKKETKVVVPTRRRKPAVSISDPSDLDFLNNPASRKKTKM